ncbi:MAG TPA: hypothetical protein VFK43_03355 [Acidimicrobiales bacterium]|nr:hypothetical protein [Acidimicrobiales bacterium]
MLRRALGVGLLFVAACGGDASTSVERAAVAPPTTEAVPSATTSAPPPAPVVEPAAVTEQATAVPVPATTGPFAAPWTLEPYHGLGAWLDAYDWSVTFARSAEHTVGLDAIDHMANEGVQTVYIQASRWNAPTAVLEPERLLALVDRAHERGMSVVAWYLPTLVDPEVDLQRMLEIAALPVDGFAVDIEARDVPDVAERNRRLVDVSARLAAALGDRPLGAIPMEPVIMEQVNPSFWPGYPWAELAPHYDVWLPMSYWTNRRGHWRDARVYTATNMVLLRQRIGDPDALVHTIGGIGDRTTVADLQGMVAAATEQFAIGGSIYDYRTSQLPFWEVLRAFRGPYGP